MKSSLALRSVCESIGAATITSAALASSYLTDSLITQALLIGLTVTTLIHCFGRISGAHFNPVVTFFLFKDDSMRYVELFSYISAQIIGAFFSVIALKKSFFLLDNIEVDRSFHFGSTFITEFIFTSLLLILISSWAREGKLCPISQPLTGVVIGIGLSIFIILSEFFGSGILNPAISIGLTFNKGTFMIIPQLIGQILAVVFIKIIC